MQFNFRACSWNLWFQWTFIEFRKRILCVSTRLSGSCVSIFHDWIFSLKRSVETLTLKLLNSLTLCLKIICRLVHCCITYTSMLIGKMNRGFSVAQKSSVTYSDQHFIKSTSWEEVKVILNFILKSTSFSYSLRVHDFRVLNNISLGTEIVDSQQNKQSWSQVYQTGMFYSSVTRMSVNVTNFTDSIETNTN
jgi:hypothetical protein